MKPDFIETVNEDDIINNTDDTPEESDTSTKIVFSCITQLEEDLIKRAFPIFLKNLGPTNKSKEGFYFEYKFEYKYIRSSYEPRFAFVYIGFPEEFFTIKDYRLFIKKLCELLRTDACTSIINSKGEHFFKDMLSNDYFKAHPNDKDAINNQFESLKNDNHIELKKIKEDIQGLSFYLCNSLLIRNIDVPIPLPIEVVDYASDITNKGINSGLFIPYPEDVIHHMMFFKGIKPNLPILLKKNMPDYKELWGDIDGRYIPEGKVLGYYKRDDEKLNFKGPHIVLGPEEIEKSAKEKGVLFHVLFSKVLVHELAHAFMDKYREGSGEHLQFTDKTVNWPVSLEARAMEESLANKITLDWFKRYATKKDVKQVRCYIEEQPAIYRFGIYQEKIDADWKKWRESIKQSTKLVEWFNKCFSNGGIKIPLDDYSREDFDKAF